MNINPSSINLDFNKEFRELYRVFIQLENTSAEFNKNKSSETNLSSPERTAHADTIHKFAKTFEAFANKYYPHKQLFFTPETISILCPTKLCDAVMGQMLCMTNSITSLEELLESFKIPQ